MESASPVQTIGDRPSVSAAMGSVSPQQPVPARHVAFELLFDSPQYRARLPMRVGIHPHDTTESIVTTVMNFYGLYSGPTQAMGVSFEDEHHNTLIARYENFRDGMTVYVKVHEGSPAACAPFGGPLGPSPEQSAFGADGPSVQTIERFGQELFRPNSRTSRRRSLSSGHDGDRRSVSASGKKIRSKSSKSRAYSQADAYSDSMNGYSSGDNAPSTTSGRNKDQLGNTDISVDNIVEGGRRKRAKFESCELPLFAPPQMPAATSNPSVSPARRAEYHRPSLPMIQPGQNPFAHPHPIPSPQKHRHSMSYATPLPNARRSRNPMSGSAAGPPTAGGVLPTPDPTVGSCMSEEDKDVAIQLMRLGDMSNISHGRTSASTLDDTFSGRADAASSTGATSDGDSDDEDEGPAPRRQKLNEKGQARPVKSATTDAHFAPAVGGVNVTDNAANHNDSEFKKLEKPRTKTKLPNGKPKPPRPLQKMKKTTAATAPGPMSPPSLPASRKPSISTGATLQTGDDEHPDLSSKPRCQRCRKSKKGCDRQRPCGRCRDAGLSADQCVSEDEGNGRKGRYGRHMGVPLKKEEVAAPPQPTLLPAAPIAAAGASPTMTVAGLDKSKKRKR